MHAWCMDVRVVSDREPDTYERRVLSSLPPAAVTVWSTQPSRVTFLELACRGLRGGEQGHSDLAVLRCCCLRVLELGVVCMYVTQELVYSVMQVLLSANLLTRCCLCVSMHDFVVRS